MKRAEMVAQAEEVARLREVEGLTFRAIAERMGIPYSRSRDRYALQQRRRRWREDYKARTGLDYVEHALQIRSIRVRLDFYEEPAFIAIQPGVAQPVFAMLQVDQDELDRMTVRSFFEDVAKTVETMGLTVAELIQARP